MIDNKFAVFRGICQKGDNGMSNNEIILFNDGDLKLEVSITPEKDTVWLTLDQMSMLFEKDRSVVGKHVRNIFREGELDEGTSGQILPGSMTDRHRPPQMFNLDVIISVGYRVKSNRGVAFRKWANRVLKEYIIKGYAINNNRVEQLGEVIKVMKRVETQLDAKQVLDVVERYNNALTLLDAYDHQTLEKPIGETATYILTYEECKMFIMKMKYAEESDLFGNEKDNSFRGSIGAIYQTFGGEEVYPSLEEKAAHLLYFLTKNHSFSDGNKRIAATLFLYFLDKNNALMINNKKRIDDYALAAMTIMIAESRTDEMDTMVKIIMNCLAG